MYIQEKNLINVTLVVGHFENEALSKNIIGFIPEPGLFLVSFAENRLGLKEFLQ